MTTATPAAARGGARSRRAQAVHAAARVSTRGACAASRRAGRSRRAARAAASARRSSRPAGSASRRSRRCAGPGTGSTTSASRPIATVSPESTHRPTGGRHRDDDRVGVVAAVGALLAPAGDDQQRVVDRHAEADQRDEELHDERDVGDVGERRGSPAASRGSRPRRSAAGRRRAARRTRTPARPARRGRRSASRRTPRAPCSTRRSPAG